MESSHDSLASRQERFKLLLEAILRQPGAKDAFDKLVSERCDRAFLECYLTEPVEPVAPFDDAESRKTDWNLAKSFLGSLEKTQRLMDQFSRFSGEPFPRLRDALNEASKRVTPWARQPRPVALFTRRQYQQFRLLERIRRETSKPFYSEAATLLAAVYAVHNIDECPHVESVTHLMKRFKGNQARWRNGSQTR